jgi:prepilin-type N-terminal cleavage/methylation domain-containing protein
MSGVSESQIEDLGFESSPVGAFSLMELLVVISIISILAALLLPALARGKGKAQGISCLNQGKQLMLAMTMYTSDYRDLFPPNPDDGNTVPGHNWCSGKAGIGAPCEFNPEVLRDEKRSLLVPYLQGDVAVFHCPADRRTGLYQGSNPSMAGRVVSAARTFSMNQAVGTICQNFDADGGPNTDHTGPPNLSVNGPWLDNTHHHRRNSPWLTYSKLSAIGSPGPANLWVLLDEDPDGLNDAAFAFGMALAKWIDRPGTYHNYGCGFAFADGHSETHQWALKSVKQRGSISNAADRRDWLWMQERTSANAKGTGP